MLMPLVESSGSTQQTSHDHLASLFAVQLFAGGEIGDSLTIWSAKSSSMDLGAILDVQLMCGAGLEATRQFLSDSSESSARLALDRIDACIGAGDFDRFSPEEHLQYYRQYFGVA